MAYEASRLEDPEQQLALAQAVVGHGLRRSEVVEAVRAKRPAPSRRPDPVALDLGEGIKVRVTWIRASGVSATQALRKALQVIQDRERAEIPGSNDSASNLDWNTRTPAGVNGWPGSRPGLATL